MIYTVTDGFRKGKTALLRQKEVPPYTSETKVQHRTRCMMIIQDRTRPSHYKVVYDAERCHCFVYLATFELTPILCPKQQLEMTIFKNVIRLSEVYTCYQPDI